MREFQTNKAKFHAFLDISGMFFERGDPSPSNAPALVCEWLARPVSFVYAAFERHLGIKFP